MEKAASEAEEPNQRIRERSSDLYELGDVLIEAVIGLKQKLSGQQRTCWVLGVPCEGVNR